MSEGPIFIFAGSAFIFMIGIAGLLGYKNRQVLFMSLTFCFQAIALSLVGFGSFYNNPHGELITLLMIITMMSYITLLFSIQETDDADSPEELDNYSV